MAKKNTSLWTILQTLVETPGPSGSEHVIREKIKAEISGHADEVYTDALGNLIARKGALKEGGKRIMISAHVDEIGLMITHVDDNGFARFLPIGGINPLTCLGGRVLFMNGTQGVIGMERINSLSQYISGGLAASDAYPMQGRLFNTPSITLLAYTAKIE